MEGAEHQQRQELQSDGDSDEKLDLGHAHCQAISDGHCFHCKVMNNLFDSPT